MNIGKILLIYLCMAIAVSIFFPQTVLENKNTSILGIFDVYYNTTLGEVVINEQSRFADPDLNIQTSANSSSSGGIFSNIIETASTYYQSFIDGLKNVLGAVKILFKFMFSPFIFIGDPNILGGAPFYVKMIFALPIILMALIGLIRFISGRLDG